MKKIWNWLSERSIKSTRRFAFAFWLGFFYEVFLNGAIQSVSHHFHWYTILLFCSITVLIFSLYFRNNEKFHQEYTWMVLKTGGKKEEKHNTILSGQAQNQSAPQRPIAPPPPPKPYSKTLR